jgi:hypothetical protein
LVEIVLAIPIGKPTRIFDLNVCENRKNRDSFG